MYNILLIIVTIHKCRVDKLTETESRIKVTFHFCKKKKGGGAVSNADVLNL